MVPGSRAVAPGLAVQRGMVPMGESQEVQRDGRHKLDL
jgi:hypothetical protein